MAASGLCNIYPTRYIHQIVQRPPGSRGEKLGEEAVWKIELLYMCRRSRERQMGATLSFLRSPYIWLYTSIDYSVCVYSCQSSVYNRKAKETFLWNRLWLLCLWVDESRRSIKYIIIIVSHIGIMLSCSPRRRILFSTYRKCNFYEFFSVKMSADDPKKKNICIKQINNDSNQRKMP